MSVCLFVMSVSQSVRPSAETHIPKKKARQGGRGTAGQAVFNFWLKF